MHHVERGLFEKRFLRKSARTRRSVDTPDGVRTTVVIHSGNCSHHGRKKRFEPSAVRRDARKLERLAEAFSGEKEVCQRPARLNVRQVMSHLRRHDYEITAEAFDLSLGGLFHLESVELAKAARKLAA